MITHTNIQKFKIQTAPRSQKQICDIIEQIDSIITSLLNTALVSVGNGEIAEYEIDTGQTKQKVKYTSTNSVTLSIKSYEQLRDYYAAKLTPRNFRLMQSKNFIR